MNKEESTKLLKILKEKKEKEISVKKKFSLTKKEFPELNRSTE